MRANNRLSIRRRAATCGVLGLVAFCLVDAPVGAQSVELTPLLTQHDVTVIVEHGDKLFAGLDGGGVAVVSATSPQTGTIWTAGADLSGNNISGMAWTGAHLWIATRGGGLTRVADPSGTPQFRQYTNNLGGLNLTGVAGAMIDGRERVFYAMSGAGIGQINDGLSGNIYTAEQDRLISNNVTAMQIWQGQLFVGTPVGVSRFANNVFTNQNAGFGSLVVNDFDLDDGGNLLAATNGGVYRWNGDTERWNFFQVVPGANSTRVSCRAGQIFALSQTALGDAVLQVGESGVWRTIPLSRPKCRSIFAGQALWIGGRTVITSGSRTLEQAYLGRLGNDLDIATMEYRDYSSTIVLNSEGVTFGTDGRIWIGDWNGQGLSATDGTDWEHVWESANVAPDSNGIFTAGGNVLCMATGPDGTIWGAQFTVGILRRDGATGKMSHITVAGSGLSGAHIVNLVTHPDGPLIAMHDPGDVEKVDILVDPVRWRNPGNWMTLPREGGLGTGLAVWDAVVERRDVIWFAVQGVGLVRWDINGDSAGPNDPLTWLDQTDDRWDAPISSIPGSSFDLGQVFGLALGKDGSLWAGGNGLVQFTYDAALRAPLLMTSIGEKASSGTEGLASGNIADIAIDANGDVWVATAVGLNRVRGTGAQVSVAAWFDLGNYYSNTVYQTLYSANVIAGLPGNFYRKIVADADGRRLLLSANQGTVLLSVGAGGGVSGGELAGAYCYPNPWVPASSGQTWLKIAGLPDGVTADDPAMVSIYDLRGELVFGEASVIPETAFWSGTNSVGNRVETGMYVVRITWHGLSTALAMAVVR